MAVKKGNTRVQVTFSEQQAKWIKMNAKKCGMTTSRFIKFLIDKNIAKFVNVLTPSEQENIIRIIRTPWLDFDEEDDFSNWEY